MIWQGRRLLARFWPWRAALAVACVALIAAAVAVDLYRERAVEPLILRAMDTAPRIASRLALAHERLRGVALETRAGTVPPALLRQEYEAFVSEIERLASGEHRALFAGLPRLEETLERLATFRQRIDAGLARSAADAFQGADDVPPELVDAMLSLLPSLRDPLADLVESAIAAQRLDVVRRTREVRVAGRLGIALSVLAGLGGLLLGLVLLSGERSGRRERADLLPALPEPGPRLVDAALVAASARDLAAALHRIAGTLGLLLRRQELGPEQISALRSAHDTADDLVELADLLADAVDLAAGVASPQATLFDALANARQALSLLEGRLRAEGGGLEIRGPAAEATVLLLGDPARFARLLRVLLTRCLPSRRGATVLVVIASAEAEVVVTIADGTAPDDALFQPVGLAEEIAPGLGAAALLVRSLGGELSRVRPAAGRPEAIRVRLPFKAAQPEPAAERRGLKLLAVDDVRTNRQLLAALLSRHGHRCDTAEDAAGALEMLRSGAYDAVLMDVQLPGIDGISAARMIRALPPPAGSVPIIAVTAHVLPEQREAFRAAGVSDVIEKPITSADLLAALARATSTGAADVPPPPAAPLAPLVDPTTIALLRSTLSAEDFDRLLAGQRQAAAEALSRAEAALQSGDRRAAADALDALKDAYDAFGAARLRETVDLVREGRSDLAALRRIVDETERSLNWRRPVPADR